MAVTERELKQSGTLSYDDYLTEGETPGRYEIVDGVRIWMTGTHDYHQDIAQNIYDRLRRYQRETGSARAYMAPVDIVTRRAPLKVRQPDVLLVSNQRYGDRRPFDKPPWPFAPELVIEVLSPGETSAEIQAKLAEYADAGVLECWLVWPEPQTIEQWRLGDPGKLGIISTFRPGQTMVSSTFSGLDVSVDQVFER